MKTTDIQFSRRNFIKATAGAGIYLASAKYSAIFAKNNSEPPVRLAFVGVGSRGMSMLETALMLEGVEIVAVCDIVAERVEKAQQLVKDPLYLGTLLIKNKEADGEVAGAMNANPSLEVLPGKKSIKRLPTSRTLTVFLLQPHGACIPQ